MGQRERAWGALVRQRNVRRERQAMQGMGEIGRGLGRAGKVLQCKRVQGEVQVNEGWTE
jgi:hypothetical protein